MFGEPATAENKIEKRKTRILIVDDSEMNRDILTDMLGEEFEIVEASDGLQAMALLQQSREEFSLMLLDIVMPNMDGFAVLEMMNSYQWIEDLPVIMISAESSPTYIEKAYELGVTDYISRPFDEVVVRRRVLNTIMLYAKQKKLINMVSDQIYEKEKSNSLMVGILSHIVEFRNGESGQHVLHIQSITEVLLKQLVKMTDKYPLSSKDISLISMASALHDIGKISIAAEILNKPGRLTNEEFAIMKNHSAIGASMLEELPVQQEEPLVRAAYAICRWHHERYDGRGYPDGLQGEEIPIAAQVVALADVYDALTSVRVYKAAYSHEKALHMILDGECGTFNPLLLDCLKESANRLRVELEGDMLNKNHIKEVRRISEEMMNHKELSISERTLQLLEHEREKYRFFSSVSKEVQFEYTAVPSMVIISDWGIQMLGLPNVIIEPHRNEQIISIVGAEALQSLAVALQQTTPEEPVVQQDCNVAVHGEPRPMRIICRATWSLEEPARYLGAIGTVVNIADA